MKTNFQKTKTVHHIMQEFHKLILDFEKIKEIDKIIPGRVDRQQKWSSETRFKISYSTQSWIKCIMSKGWTAQELFIICQEEKKDTVKNQLKKILNKHKEITHTFKDIRTIQRS